MPSAPRLHIPRPRETPGDDVFAPLHSLEGVGLATVDPYFLWALLTDFKGFGGAGRGDEQPIPFLIELEQRGKVRELADVETRVGEKLVEIGRSYIDDLGTRYCTGRVRRKDIPTLLKQPLIRRADMGVAGIAGTTGGDASAPLDLPDSMGVVHERIVWGTATTLVGVIDHGIALLNSQFRLDFEDPASKRPMTLRRIVSFWDQWAGPGGPADRGAPWKPEARFGYGVTLTPEVSADGYEYPTVDRTMPEAQVYRRWGYEPVFGVAAHGTHVLDLAAGGPNPLHRLPGMPQWDDACYLPVVAVQLPWVPAKDVSGASLCVQVLDGLRYIVERAGETRPVVVNISDGAMAGSHNAGSVLEAAIDERLAEHDNLSIVVAAGNANEANAHARGTIAADGKVTLEWHILPGDTTETFLEVWVDDVADLSVELTPPGGSAPVVEASRNVVDAWPQPAPHSGRPQVVAACIHLEAVASGRGQLALLALRPTRNADPRANEAVVPHGWWTVTLRNHMPSKVGFNAWVERDDPPFGDFGPRRQSTLRVPGEQPAVRVTGEDTMNSIATGDRPIVVGGYRLSDRRFARYTSGGGADDLRKKPTVVAPSEERLTLPGLPATGNASGSTVRINGTSVAAPVVVRLIANAMAGRGDRAAMTGMQVKQAVRNAAQELAPRSRGPVPDGTERAARAGSGWIDPSKPLDL